MKRKIGYKLGYQIQINNGFYEVVYGKRAVFYGYCNTSSTIQEIINKTILSEDSFINAHRKTEIAAGVGL